MVAAPRPCLIPPETVVDFPPIACLQPGEFDASADLGLLRGILPAHLEQAGPAWLGGWIRDCGFFPKPSEYCDSGAPAFSLLDTTFEGLDSPWQPVAEPEFSWNDPDDEDWGGHRSPGIWGGRNGELWLPACSADPSHPIRAEVE